MHPKFALYFNSRNPGAPFGIKEHCFIEGKLASKHISAHKHLTDALEALSDLSDEPVMIAFTVDMVEG